jgi:hypothetical protein
MMNETVKKRMVKEKGEGVDDVEGEVEMGRGELSLTGCGKLRQKARKDLAWKKSRNDVQRKCTLVVYYVRFGAKQ